MQLELLSPAKNLEYGQQAINHGADAVYIGAPAFGARQAATNSIADIDALVRYAHLYKAKVFATVNTLLFDDEVPAAVAMIRQLYDCGVDALIVQDMGLLQCDLPPIELHASTQCHNASLERIKFMQTVGFRRIILPRETSLQQMQSIRQQCNVDLEAFVHGALCVSYSGQCYMSQYLNGRSGNRGSCSQPCRSAYDLYSATGRLILRQQHLLSLRDFNASAHIQEMADAGITSFKIEGRLKDIAYLKNITAYYRQLIDSMLSGYTKASSGKCTFHFMPDPERTFNRGFTDYFLTHRQPMASFATQKSLGKPIGEVLGVKGKYLVINATEPVVPGDGLCYISPTGVLQGFMVNGVQGNQVLPNAMPDVKPRTQLWRNHDHAFERLLSANSAERKMEVRCTFDVADGALRLTMADADGNQATATADAPLTPSANPQGMQQTIATQLAKLGNTPFVCAAVTDNTGGRYFAPASLLATMRRQVVERLMAIRTERYHPCDTTFAPTTVPYPTEVCTYKANIVNQHAEDFYRQHGVKHIERGLEQTADYADKDLMTTKYCLRYELGCCMKRGGANQKLGISATDTLVLRNNTQWFTLHFDCDKCLMQIRLRSAMRQ